MRGLQLSSNTDQGSGYYAIESNGASGHSDGLSDWLNQRQKMAEQKAVTPAMLGLQRLQLASDRCKHLADAIDDARFKLLNVPWYVEQGAVHSLEERVLRLESQLHEERLAAWGVLRELLSGPIEDARLEQMRLNWIERIGSIMHDGGGST